MWMTPAPRAGDAPARPAFRLAAVVCLIEDGSSLGAAPIPGDLWPQLCNHGARSLALAESPLRRVEIGLAPSDLLGVEPADLPLVLLTSSSVVFVKL